MYIKFKTIRTIVEGADYNHNLEDEEDGKDKYLIGQDEEKIGKVLEKNAETERGEGDTVDQPLFRTMDEKPPDEAGDEGQKNYDWASKSDHSDNQDPAGYA